MKLQRVSNIVFLCFVSLIICFFSFSYIINGEESFSEDENRLLQTLPRFTFEKLFDGTYTRQLHDYFSDQINLRSELIEIKATAEMLMGKKENNGILLGKDGYLIEAHSYNEENYTILKKNIQKIEKLMHSIEKNGTLVNSVIIPRKIDILQDYYPNRYSGEKNQEAWSCLSENHINLTQSFINSTQNGTQLFYKTDHHWTGEGAYLAYVEIANLLGIVPHNIDHFKLQTLSKEFHGTNYSKSGLFFINSEEIKAPSIDDGRYRVTIVDTDTEFDTLYDFSYLEKKDKYSVFLSGNNAHVIIYDTQDTAKETLLLIKDSFSHSLAPYLCEHYNLELIDPRYYRGSIEEYIKENNIKKVIFLFGIDTLASSNIIIR